MSEVSSSGDGGPEEVVGPFVASGPFVVVAPFAVIATGEKQKRPTSRTRLVNAVLFAIVAALATIWFVVHVKVLVTEVIVLGGITIWSLVQILVTQLKAAVEDDAKTLWGRLLETKKLGIVLRVLVGLFLLAFVFTSSFYVRLGSTALSTVKIDAVEGKETVARVDLAFNTKVDGRAFGPIAWRTLRLQVKQPVGYHDELVKLRPGEALTLSFPEQFRRRSLVRIYVPYSLREKLPQKGEDQFPRTALLITANQQRGRVAPFGFRTAYVGVPDAGLSGDLIAQAMPAFEEARRSELRSHISDNFEIERHVAKWREEPFVTHAWDLEPGEVVKAEYRIGDTTVLSCSAKVSESRITDCVLTEPR